MKKPQRKQGEYRECLLLRTPLTAWVHDVAGNLIVLLGPEPSRNLNGSKGTIGDASFF